MEWKDLAATVGKYAPLVGTLIGGPAGAAIGAMVSSGLGVVNSPDDVAQALQINPDIAVKLKQIESDNQVELQKLVVQSEANRLASDTAAILAVNATMQVEAKADHWPTYSWRPFVGFVFGVMFIGVYFVLPLARLPVPTVPTEAWFAIGGVLGVASWFRGKAQADPNITTDNRG
jgi:hypothetical protein